MPDFDPLTHAGSMPSPCNDVCTMNQKSGLCDGCLRTIDEIVQWGGATEHLKRAIWLKIKQREVALFEGDPPNVP